MRWWAVFATGCGGPFGLSQVGNEGDVGDPCEVEPPTVTPLQGSDPIWDGHTIDAVLAALAVQDTGTATVEGGGGESRVDLELQLVPDPATAVIAARPEPCLARFSLSGEATLSTADGALDEAWTFELAWTETERTDLVVRFGSDRVEGTLDVAGVLGEPEGTPFHVYGEVEVHEDGDTHGWIDVEAESGASSPTAGVPSPASRPVHLLSW